MAIWQAGPLVAVSLVLLVSGACGGDGDQTATGTTPSTPSSTGPSG